MQRFSKFPALFLLGAFAAAPVSAATIDFEGFAAGTNITNQIPGVTFSTASGLLGQTWIFDTNNFTGGDSDLAAPFDKIGTGAVEEHRPGNVLIIQENAGPEPDDLAGGGVIDIFFDTVTTVFSIDFFDMEANTSVLLLDTGAVLIDSFFTGNSDTANNVTPNRYEHLVFDGPDGVAGVKQIQIVMTGSGAIDSIVHRTSVPLPPTLWLMGVAVLGLIAVSRRRQTT